MTWLSILSCICRAIGLFSWADKLWIAHEAKIKAQEVSNAPITDKEESDYFRNRH